MTTKPQLYGDWQIIRPLGQGGQGKTFLVRNTVQEVPKAVLKTLVRPGSVKARRRMIQEVTNLGLLHKAHCKVPEVIDEQISPDDTDSPAYFVMEFVDGPTLDKVIENDQSLPFDLSVDIALDLARTTAKALDEQVIHRDIKPKNLILTAREPPSVTVLDYGLSFNNLESTEITSTAETITNEFLRLPERSIPGDDRRDPRSDFAGIAAILYYCLTGVVPAELRSGADLPPHKRKGGTLAERIGDEPRIEQMEPFFDRAFQPNLGLRFQTIDDLIDRLGRLKCHEYAEPLPTPQEFVAESAARLRVSHRKSQIAHFQQLAHGCWSEFMNHARQFHNAIAPYQVHFQQGPPYQPNKTLTGEIVQKYRVTITLQQFTPARRIYYVFLADGTECSLQRAISTVPDPRVEREIDLTDLEPVFWYQGPQKPDLRQMIQDFDAQLVLAMRHLEQACIASQ